MSPFWLGVFQDRVLWTISPGWFETQILLISAPWVARIIDVSHWCVAWLCIEHTRHILPLGLFTCCFLCLSCFSHCSLHASLLHLWSQGSLSMPFLPTYLKWPLLHSSLAFFPFIFYSIAPMALLYTPILFILFSICFSPLEYELQEDKDFHLSHSLPLGSCRAHSICSVKSCTWKKEFVTIYILFKHCSYKANNSEKLNWKRA
jgi:hypothetical protein